MSNDYPILEHVVDVFVGMLDKKVELEVNKRSSRVARVLFESPEKADDVISREARDIVKSVDAKLPQATLEKARDFAGKIDAELKEISSANRRLSSLVASLREREDERRRVAEGRTAERQRRQDERETAERERRNQEEESRPVDCYCTCTRDGSRRHLGKMTAAQCGAICSGPC